jgi:dTDP-4-amino-4,6-dideoxygalactose transaminase
VFLIDDAAQAMGASVNGRWSGTWGDAGLFSFDKGKNISAIDGGVVVTSSDDIAVALRKEMATLPSPGVTASGVHIAKALAYFTLLRPWLYAIPTQIPQLALGKTVYTTEFPLQLADPSLMALGVVMMRRLEQFTSARQANASSWLEGLKSLPGIATLVPIQHSTPVYLRLPVLFENENARNGALRQLTAAGIGATGSYPQSLIDVPELRPHLADALVSVNGGRSVAKRIATLPTHPFVTSADIARALNIIQPGNSITCAA